MKKEIKIKEILNNLTEVEGSEIKIPEDNITYNYYYLRNSNEVFEVYDELIELSNKLNFGGNPLESNSYIVIECENKTISIDSPTTYNGDKNWNSYNDKIRKMMCVTTQIN
ncbi:hypothetical protein [Olleya marilimosa]|uniref:hypothetical protein n=1 Tax=Olleya marilimosa TaxID=272164 RepID=UPI0030ED799D|tara:strand:+ start:98080 stop:98412 length:333 start_codon:yes stop_codon:yes gene_type:complete